MNKLAYFEQIQTLLHANANPQRAVEMRAYMRNQFEFIGINTPLRRQLVRSLGSLKWTHDDALQLAQALWTLSSREYQYVAIDLLARHKKGLQLLDIPILLELAQNKAWWDTVDGLAAIVGDVVRLGLGQQVSAQQQMDQALESSSMWVRRIAMLHQLGWRTQTDADRLFSYALRLAPEPDFFIRKAIGWALRDYARWNPATVQKFVHAHSSSLSPLSAREALKHLR
ncbi:DNA alkylation repair protein [Undibacterium fentianense]|uniref:DNA alkylation repair protein n=1 Tax=Undibacterium fentianense TaxID=2828728 RepID=A0A941E1G1_9BURK|nr:DNA alkylation repair protein [Undibacterium fentianense]MBR7800650.1 DNA alkylation repair protein [Undibacterium fentianense]